MVTNKQPVELLTKEQVAKRLNMSPRSVYRKSQLGEIPKPVKIGTLSRWPSDVLDDWIERGCKPFKI